MLFAISRYSRLIHWGDHAGDSEVTDRDGPPSGTDMSRRPSPKTLVIGAILSSCLFIALPTYGARSGNLSSAPSGTTASLKNVPNLGAEKAAWLHRPTLTVWSVEHRLCPADRPLANTHRPRLAVISSRQPNEIL
ncbi:hypothetical protein Bbelb_299070 [Branchiostoma belcheri]|nr:hypothetical protein Bbelb_299070 [Branchiostoma belcheri]